MWLLDYFWQALSQEYHLRQLDKKQFLNHESHLLF
jgi:hypothetical protein